MANIRDEIQKAYDVHHGTPSSGLQGGALGANRVVMVGAGRLPHHQRKHRHHFTRVAEQREGHKKPHVKHHNKKERTKADVGDAVKRAMDILNS